MTLTVYQITAKFPHKIFPIIEGEPDCHITHTMWTLLYGNTSTLSTTLGGYNRGNVGLIMQDILYAKIPPTPYNALMDPGGTAQVPAQETTAVFSKLRYEHAEARCIFDNHNNMDVAIKTMVLVSVYGPYIFSLHNVFTWYMGSLTK